MSPYNPASLTDRRDLASTLIGTLEGFGFELVPSTRNGQDELVYKRDHQTRKGFEVRIYTSVVSGPGGVKEVRESGADAIRAALIYRKKDNTTRGIGSETRVNRTGDIQGIVTRSMERLRSVYRKAGTTECCSRCGAPKFKSKNDNMVCAEICWKN